MYVSATKSAVLIGGGRRKRGVIKIVRVMQRACATLSEPEGGPQSSLLPLGSVPVCLIRVSVSGAEHDSGAEDRWCLHMTPKCPLHHTECSNQETAITFHAGLGTC